MNQSAYETPLGTIQYWVSESAQADLLWLVFLPGLTADHTLFNAQLARFEDHANCLVWDPDAGHNANVDNPDFVNAQIERFLHESMRRQRTAKAGKRPGLRLAQAHAEARLRMCDGEADHGFLLDTIPRNRLD